MGIRLRSLSTYTSSSKYQLIVKVVQVVRPVVHLTQLVITMMLPHASDLLALLDVLRWSTTALLGGAASAS
jgi:hypothetical protein